MENNLTNITKKDILKHYFASLLVYGAVLIFIILCPIYYSQIQDGTFNYMDFFIIYFVGYIFIAPIVYFIAKPRTISDSNNIKILKYITRQFKKQDTTQDFLANIEPKEDEKQALMGLFIKTFFGVNCVHFLCSSYIPSLGYNFDFLRAIWENITIYMNGGSGIFKSLVQYTIDTGDVWIKLIMTLTTLILAFSYLTDSVLFKNKIKSTDTTPLGVLSCIICYYPITILTTKFISPALNELIPINNHYLFAVLNFLIIIVNFIGLIATIRLFGKAGNLTNRGIVTGFPYNIIRHPIYLMEILYIVLSAFPILFLQDYPLRVKFSGAIGIIIWILIYYLRSITEERHLIKDEKYQEYVKKVRYRFIPKLF